MFHIPILKIHNFPRSECFCHLCPTTDECFMLVLMAYAVKSQTHQKYQRTLVSMAFKTAQHASVLASKPSEPSSAPGTHIVDTDTQLLQMLSDLHMSAAVCSHVLTCKHNKYSFQGNPHLNFSEPQAVKTHETSADCP